MISRFVTSLRVRPFAWAALTWFSTLLLGALAMVLAEFGAPLAIFVALAAWLWTAGLPTLLAVLACATAWGRLPGLETPPLPAFLISAAALGFAAQVGAHVGLAKWLARRAPRPA